MKLSHSQVVREIAQLSGHHIPTVEDVLQKLALVIWKNSAMMNEVQVRDIGTIKPKRHKGRKVTNVVTKEVFTCSPYTKVTLLPCQGLREYASKNHESSSELHENERSNN